MKAEEDELMRCPCTQFMLVIVAVVVAAISSVAASQLPSVQSISPTTVAAGSNGFTPSVTGKNFNSAEMISWQSGTTLTKLPTKSAGSTQAQAEVPAAHGNGVPGSHGTYLS